ncbi:MAG: NAD(P)H-binding protein [Solirubrobacteraceae bacterium]
MIVVTGAGGNVGGELAAQLAAAGEPVRAIVRDPARAALPDGVEVVAGDLELPESLTPAFAGARAVFLLGGWSDMPGIVRRIGGAGAERIVLLTSRCVIGGRPDNAITGMWLDAEAAVEAGAVPWTIVRPSGFQSNALRWRFQLAAGDVVRAPWPGVRIAAIDPADIAAVAAVALTADGHAGDALELSGPEALTPADQVAQLGEALGRPLRYEPQTDAEARAELGDSPAVDAQFRFFSEGEYDDARVVGTVRAVTGRAPGRFADWARAHAGDF